MPQKDHARSTGNDKGCRILLLHLKELCIQKLDQSTSGVACSHS